MLESKGKLVGTGYGFESRKVQLTFEFDKDISGLVEEIRDTDLNIAVKKYRQKRSLDANAYYWLLITKLADRLQMSKPCLHNMMLRRYGQPEIINEKLMYLVVPDNDDGSRRADEAETYHIKPTNEVKFGADGTGYRTYIMLRGSSTYDTKEMSTLINGLVENCREQGIDTISPEEFAHMMELYDKSWRKKHEEAV